MKRSRFTEEQIVFAIQQVEAGVPVKELCRKYEISTKTFYTWRKKFGGLGSQELRELRQLREENRRLKGLVADLSLDRQILKDALAKKRFPGRIRGPRDGDPRPSRATRGGEEDALARGH